jgi:hypothetical protein
MGTPGRSSTTAHAYLLPSWNGQHTILTLPHRSAHEHPHVADLGRRIPLWKPPVRRGHQVGRLRSDDNCLVLSPLAAHAAQRWGVWALFGDLSSNRRQPVVVFCLCRPSKRQADDSISGRVAALRETRCPRDRGTASPGGRTRAPSRACATGPGQRCGRCLRHAPSRW